MRWNNETMKKSVCEREEEKGRGKEKRTSEEGNWEVEDRRQGRGRHLPFWDGCWLGSFLPLEAPGDAVAIAQASIALTQTRNYHHLC